MHGEIHHNYKLGKECTKKARLAAGYSENDDADNSNDECWNEGTAHHVLFVAFFGTHRSTPVFSSLNCFRSNHLLEIARLPAANVTAVIKAARHGQNASTVTGTANVAVQKYIITAVR